jgi:glycerol-3-phosphate dehydrogenase
MERVNVVIVGAGVVGCATALALARHHSDVFVVEQLPRPGMLTSTRNSGVIHSGVYYPTGSLKARHCVRGNRLLYEFCAAHGVPHRRTGKVIVASDASETAELDALRRLGEANGVEGLRILDRAALRRREPHVQGVAALEIDSTGIVSSEELVKAFARLAVQHGANLLMHTRVTRLEPAGAAIRVWMHTGEDSAATEEEVVETRCLVNSAGLFADDVAALLGNTRWRIYPVRGEYCEVVRSKAYLIAGLVYPLPHPEGLSLGVHFTRTLHDTVLVGPTARYIEDKNDYERDREPVEEFARRAKLLVPEIEPNDLTPAYSGIRPKLVPPGPKPAGKGFADFVITPDPQFPQVIHLMGIESPGLTAAPSIAEQVREMVAAVLS